MWKRDQVFVILRDAPEKMLTFEELFSRWKSNFLSEGDIVPSRELFHRYVESAFNAGLIWRVAHGVYQARPPATVAD